MRLIDADNIYNVGNFVILHKDGNAYVSLADICKIIDIQPTAYDVDKVVSQLRKDKFIDCETVLSDVHQGYNAGLSRAIEIVKAGGKNDNNL